MSEPCSEKENIDKIWDKLESRDEILRTMQIKQAEIAGDISHVKTRIDNGMSHTIARIDANLIEIKPVIAHHANIVKRIEDFGWLISRWLGTGLIVCLLGLIVWAIGKGFMPRI